MHLEKKSSHFIWLPIFVFKADISAIVGLSFTLFSQNRLNWHTLTCPGLLSDWPYGKERPCVAACLCRMTSRCKGQGGVHLFWICLTCSNSLDTFNLMFPRPESITALVLLWLHLTCTFHYSEALDIEHVWGHRAQFGEPDNHANRP